MLWYLYIVECSDNSLYTGITTSVERRINEHNTNDKLGAKSLRGKRPVTLVHLEEFKSSSEARKREIVIKNLTREDKLRLIKTKTPLNS